ncbi:hypothetical protein C4D60_Mb05t02660 [Musa balbisiana]|uniref:AAA+ ATPase domain-containing protein n=1 Tax=Musa balbisiana TaxID=52838 RepID=A0A4S8JT70_MUSBA|nr:hypothetical protein C4D60_Mb05t02660 [Musa balbisiana]
MDWWPITVSAAYIVPDPPPFSRHSSYSLPQSLLLLLWLPATMLWVDKYRPRALDKIIAHEEIAQNLKKLVSDHDCPHLLFYGPTGSGKKTLVMTLLKQMFGPGAEKVKLENKMWKIDAGTRMIELELTMLSSTHHVEMNPSDAVLVLNEVDKLSREGQHSLRRKMEKYSASCRLILCCNSSSKVTEAVRLFSVRGKIYELLVNCIPPEIILKKLLSELLKKLDSEFKHEVCHWAAYYVSVL